MKVSESWLSDWVKTPLQSEALAEKLTLAGLEVDEIARASGVFTHVYVAHVLATHPHPKADRLTVCSVDVGEAEPVQIVCGATNVRANLKVALARPGADLPGGIHIKATALRGEASEGMICSSPELGLEESAEGILELPEDAPVGMPLQDYLSLDDKIFMIELTPNRADCFSMRGIAREVAALTDTQLMTPEIKAVAPTLDGQDAVVPIEVIEQAACPAYALRLIQGIDTAAKTPLWMKERLRRAGIRAIHPAVDVTQYIMLEFGQPMHAFDAAKVTGTVQVRLSQKGEQLVLLDGQTVTLDAGVLLIADEQKPLAIAGVMGGFESAVTDKTRDVLLESAFFAPAQIAGVARAHGLCTDASQRFERGVDPALYQDMMERATALLLAITGGEVGPVVCEQVADDLPHREIAFRPARVIELTGLEVPEAEMQRLLGALGMKVSISTAGTPWQVTVPSYRFDIALEVDLVEEIARLHGYDALQPTASFGVLRQGRLSETYQVSRAVAACLSHRGYHEVMSYSFVDPEVQAAFYPDAKQQALLNPLSSELSQMRAGLWPGLMSALLHNVSRQQTTVRCFETGVIFDTQNNQCIERPVVAGLVMGESGGLHWAETTRAYDFYDVKGDVCALFAAFNQAFDCVPEALSALHPGKSARLYVNGAPVGWMGVLHPALAEAFGLSAEVMLFEIAQAAFENIPTIRYQRISKYPKVQRDLSLLVDEGVDAAQIEAVVRDALSRHPALLKEIAFFDQYMGAQVPEGKKSLAIALFFQADAQTLTEEEITGLMQAVIDALKSELAITIRDGV